MRFVNDEAREYYHQLIKKGRFIHMSSGAIATVEELKEIERVFDEMNQEELKEKETIKDLDYYFTNIQW